MVVSREFLKFSWSRKELDGLTTRSKVVAILSDIIESDVADTPPGSPSRLSRAPWERLVRLIRPEER